MDPWGTPDRTGLEDDLVSLRFVLFHRRSSLKIAINYQKLSNHISIDEQLSRD